MYLLQKVTTVYVDTEDRIKIAGELSSGDTIVFWLSQRMLLRLLPHLFLWLDKQFQNEIPIEIQQSFAQEAAIAKADHESAVESALDTQAWLVRSIDINSDNNNLRLCFKGAESQEALLPFTAHELRQWLSILYTLWQAGEWPLEVWPQWMQDTTTNNDPKSTSASYH